MGSKHPLQRIRIPNVDLLKGVSRIVGNREYRFEVGRVGQLIDIDHPNVGIVDQVADHGRTDETGTSCDQNGPNIGHDQRFSS